MKNRDKAIQDDLKRFRCMSRDDIIDLHFSNLKNPVCCCNIVLKRLRRDELIDVNTSTRPYVYFPQSRTISKTSQKIPHFLGIVDIYKQLIKYEQPKLFDVEPKFGKGFVEPDAFAIWRRSPFFIEVQKSTYSKKVMQAKINRYLTYYHNGEWKKLHWQPRENKIFPSILLISDVEYDLQTHNLRFFQSDSIDNFMSSLSVK
ncbi:replication-relaxation family protein [Bacillus toyonensis]|uniref:replication-relaxation family protein n=1 Tax=Bacillus toyonensis TaxID=155322 RepID=UPI00027BEA5E|nr:replication-relaxation family protein [Bacillus toyonensis]EJV41762.1 hypothetical protein IEA_05647 [Bacillus toyonensis]